jgi:hypothetical protein
MTIYHQKLETLKLRELTFSKKWSTHCARRDWWRGQARIASSDFYRNQYLEKAAKEERYACHWLKQCRSARDQWMDMEHARKMEKSK